MFSGDMPFSANSDAENLFHTEGSVPSISQNLEVKKEESSSIPDFTTIDRCKKFQTLLNAGPLKDEALTLQNILATQFSNWAAFQLSRGVIHFLLLCPVHSQIILTWKTRRQLQKHEEYLQNIFTG